MMYRTHIARFARLFHTSALSAAVGALLAGCGEGTAPTPPTPTPVATHIEMLTTGELSGPPGWLAGDSVAVRVTDQNGAAMSGVTVNFAVTAGGGVVSPTSKTTDASGIARTAWTLGAQEGANQIQASVAGSTTIAPVMASATAKWGPETAIALTGGSAQVAPATCTLPTPATFKVTNAAGEAVAGANVYLDVQSGGGTLGSVVVKTDAQGIAKPDWRLGAAAGDNVLRARIASPTSAAVTVTATAKPAAPGGFSTIGNQIWSTTTCSPHRFLGIARAGLDNWPTGDDRLISPTLASQDFAGIKSWGMNVVRIPIGTAYWLPGNYQYNAGYQALVDSTIKRARRAGLDVIIDMHYSDRGDPNWGKAGEPNGIQKGPDAAHAITIWKQIAAKYKDDGHIIFQLYSEPHHLTWDQWLNGGMTADSAGVAGEGVFEVAGYQKLYDAVRSTGAENLVIINGMHWGFNLSGVASGAYRVNGHNIAYATHPYNWPDKQPPTWDAAFGNLSATDPVIITEFGTTDCSTDYYKWILDYADAHNLGWLAWAWWAAPADHPELVCTYTALLSDWSGTPNQFGTIVKTRIAGYNH